MPKIDEAAGAVLVGGKSSRMGRDKARVLFAGASLLERATGTLARVFPEVLVVGRDPGREQGREGLGFDTPGRVRLVPDEEPGLGPLGGIATALAESSRPWVFVAACDMPFLDERVIARLWELTGERPGCRGTKSSSSATGHKRNAMDGEDKYCVPRQPLAAAPVFEWGPQPLAAFYHKDALGPAREAIARGELSARSFLESIAAAHLEVAPGSSEARALVNVNTEEELVAAMGEVGDRGAPAG